MYGRLFIKASMFVLALSAAHAENGKSELYLELASLSYPSHPTSVTLTNPWGENLTAHKNIPADFGLRVATAAAVYSDQKIRFDGYFGSDDDGMHYAAAADGKDNAYYGSEEKKSYYVSRNGKIDDLTERTWVCPDLPVHAVSLAGFPLREAMIQDWEKAKYVYMAHGLFLANQPTGHTYFRRVLNLQRYLKRAQFWSEDRITPEQYRDPDFRPISRFKVGDIVLFGHYKDVDNLSPWSPKHSGIVASVDERGLPVKIYNMRVSSKMYDDYGGRIDQTRPIGGKRVYFKYFLDRYSLTGHGRIVNPYRAEPEEPIKPKVVRVAAKKEAASPAPKAQKSGLAKWAGKINPF